jgi:hypothetical protein
MASFPSDVAVPTLDVDLAWHTAQLSPKAYYDYSIQKCNKFIDHDDKIAEDKLATAFEWTSKTYQELYGEVYSECTCWYCESLRVSHISGVGKLFGVSKQEKSMSRRFPHPIPLIPIVFPHSPMTNGLQSRRTSTPRVLRSSVRPISRLTSRHTTPSA